MIEMTKGVVVQAESSSVLQPRSGNVTSDDYFQIYAFWKFQSISG